MNKRNKRVLKLCLVAVLLMGAMVIGYDGRRNHIYHDQRPSVNETYVLIMKSEGNPYNEMAAAGFQQVIGEYGARCEIKYPESANVEKQIPMIQAAVKEKVDAIAIAANDRDALEPELKKAMEQGIKVSTLDSNTNPMSRMIFVNQTETAQVGRALMDAVLDIAGGEGQWAILSATSQADNQNSWIGAMKEIMQEDRYRNLRLVDIVYGDDEYQKSIEKTEELIRKYPELKVICAPTVVGIHAAAEKLEAVRDSRQIKLTGLGLPDEMADYITGKDPVCPYMYLWNPADMGRLSAYVSIALVRGDVSGKAGEIFSAGNMGGYEIQPCLDGGSEVIVGPPLKFDAENIESWKKTFQNGMPGQG